MYFVFKTIKTFYTKATVSFPSCMLNNKDNKSYTFYDMKILVIRFKIF